MLYKCGSCSCQGVQNRFGQYKDPIGLVKYPSDRKINIMVNFYNAPPALVYDYTKPLLEVLEMHNTAMIAYMENKPHESKRFGTSLNMQRDGGSHCAFFNYLPIPKQYATSIDFWETAFKHCKCDHKTDFEEFMVNLRRHAAKRFYDRYDIVWCPRT